MRIIFMGTPDFAVPSLEKLAESGHEICMVFCQPDKPKGRGHKLQYPPVKEAALSRGIPVCQALTLKDEAVQRQIRELQPDLIVVAAYGKILPKAVLAIPKFGCINVHGSLLPKYRGAAPIQRAVLNGEKTTGVTLIYMAQGIDTGDMIAARETAIGPEETAGELFDRLKVIGAELLAETLGNMPDGILPRTPQDEGQATYAPMLAKDEGLLDWTKPAGELHNQIRGLNPWPSAYTFYNGRKMKIHRAERLELNGESGAIEAMDGDFIVYCGSGALRLTEIQPENSKRMDGRSYLLGHPLHGTRHFDLKSGEL